MSPIGRVFIVLNLILAGTFVGFSGTHLQKQFNWKKQAEKVQAEEVEEPVKVTKKAAAPEPKSEIADIVGDWDDE
jgi:hypothetical protein